MSAQEDRGANDALIGSLLKSISEVIRSLESLQSQTTGSFLETACYFYRVSVVLMEIQTGESSITCPTDVVESLSESIDAAKHLLEMSQESSNGPEPSIEAGFGGVVKQIGETLQCSNLSLVNGGKDIVFFLERLERRTVESFLFMEANHPLDEPIHLDSLSSFEVKVDEFTAAGRVSHDVAAEEEVRCGRRGEIRAPGTETPGWK
nr:PREDICTED: uncharacterized protein LOC108824504 [Raphanus sativus]